MRLGKSDSDVDSSSKEVGRGVRFDDDFVGLLGFLARAFELVSKLLDRDGGEASDLDSASAAHLRRYASNGLIVWGVDHGDEIVWAEQRVLRDDFGSELLDFSVNLFDSLRAFFYCSSAFRCECGEKDVGWHAFGLLCSA